MRSIDIQKETNNLTVHDPLSHLLANMSGCDGLSSLSDTVLYYKAEKIRRRSDTLLPQNVSTTARQNHVKEDNRSSFTTILLL